MRTMFEALVVAVGLLSGMVAVPAAEPPPAGGLIKALVSGIPHAALFGLAFDGQNGVAVGAGGVVLESSDGGSTWKASVQDQTSLAMLAVDRRGTHTIAVGQAGMVLVREGQGAWIKAPVSPPSRLLSVSVNEAGLAIAAGEFGTVLKSTDAGRTWASIAPDWASMADRDAPGTGEPTLYSAYIDGAGEMTIAGEFGVMMRSSDGGTHWRVLLAVQPKAPTLFATFFAPAGQGNSYAVGQAGEILKSPDGGASWFRCSGYTSLNLLGVAASPTGQVVITGMRVMLRSQNAGTDWALVNEGDISTDWYQTVRSVSASGRILAVGHAGRIIEIGS